MMNNRTTKRLGFALVALIALAGCGTNGDTDGEKVVTLIAYDSFTPEEGIFDEFTERTGATVKVVTAGDTGTMVAKAILTAGNPEGDVMWGIDNTFLSRAEKAGVLNDYVYASYGDICVNYDKGWFAERELSPPSGFLDLVRPEYRGLLTVQDPVNSSPGLGFMLATIIQFGEPGWIQYWNELKQNDVNIAPDWSSAYYEAFSGSSGKGSYPLVVSYGSSPPAEVVFAETPIDEPPTGVITQTCFEQSEFVGVMRGTKNPDLAEELVAFLTDVTFQESIPLTLFVYPANPDARLPDVFTKFAQRPENPLTFLPEEIEINRERWLDTWRGIFS